MHSVQQHHTDSEKSDLVIPSKQFVQELGKTQETCGVDSLHLTSNACNL